MNSREFRYKKARKYASSLQDQISFKLEDKILLGIAGLFLILMIALFSFLNDFLKMNEKAFYNVNPPEALLQEDKTTKEMKEAFVSPFQEFEANFQHLGEVLEEDQQRQEEFYQKAKEIFHKRFKKASEKFRK